MYKIRKTVDACIENYSLYKQSEYYAKYGSGDNEKVNGVRLIDVLPEL